MSTTYRVDIDGTIAEPQFFTDDVRVCCDWYVQKGIVQPEEVAPLQRHEQLFLLPHVLLTHVPIVGAVEALQQVVGIGYPLDHLPCSLYPLYGVDLRVMSCLNQCVPSSCKGNGGGCKPDEAVETKESILEGTRVFVDAYTDVFGVPPDVTIWNQLAGYFDASQ